jgi:hypothetical protein
MRIRLKEEGDESVTACHALKMKAADEKCRLPDAANSGQLLRIIRILPSLLWCYILIIFRLCLNCIQIAYKSNLEIVLTSISVSEGPHLALPGKN